MIKRSRVYYFDVRISDAWNGCVHSWCHIAAVVIIVPIIHLTNLTDVPQTTRREIVLITVLSWLVNVYLHLGLWRLLVYAIIEVVFVISQYEEVLDHNEEKKQKHFDFAEQI